MGAAIEMNREFMSALEQYVKGYFGVHDDDIAAITSMFKTRSLKKGDHFLKAGRNSEELGFVQDGLLREYLVVEGKEVTKWVSTTGYFSVDLYSFVFNEPARWNIEALTDVELWVLPTSDYQRLDKLVPAWADLEKKFITRCFAALEDRVLQFISMSAEERYQYFFRHHPELFVQVPLQYLASLLGMTPETFSRIRNRKAKG
jgi:CRP-like cAMP-binding protein